MRLLVPGRHHALTFFQHAYLAMLADEGLAEAMDVHWQPLGITEPVDAIIFAVTSAGHAGTRRNPVPFYLRAVQLEDFSRDLGVPTFVYGIEDVGLRDDFAEYTLKSIKHASEGRFDCTPADTVVVCSTPVLELYERLGFRILPAELSDRATWRHDVPLPWDVVERIANPVPERNRRDVPPEASPDWRLDPFVRAHLHSDAFAVWSRYRLGEKVRALFADPMIGADGDLTTTRDYNSYVRQMDEIAELKFRETVQFVRPGRIGDIGCAVGSWLKLVAAEPRLAESDLFGIEVARHLFEVCQQRVRNGEFAHPFVFFAQKNAVTGPCFEPGSMDTVHTSSLTHEIESYGGSGDLERFIVRRFEELKPGGVWVNRDVVGPEHGDETVLLWCRDDDGADDGWDGESGDRAAAGEAEPGRANGPTCRNGTGSPVDRETLKALLDGLSTRARFRRFARDFRQAEGFRVAFAEANFDGRPFFKLQLSIACEFLSRKDYTGNWQSEMHETFCFWSFADWKRALTEAGFRVHPASRAWTNDWLVTNRWRGKAELFREVDGRVEPMDYPVTHMVLVGEK